MTNYKTMILPILTVLAGAITLIFKIDIKHDTIDFVATILAVAIGAGVNIWGIYTNHKKGVDQNDNMEK